MKRSVATAILVAAAVSAAGCGADEREEATPPPRAQLASGKLMPARCVAGEVRPAATVTFVANGRAWALEPGSRRLTCLFPAPHAGPFEWGPRGDRALLARLEVKSLGPAPTRPPGAVDPPAVS